VEGRVESKRGEEEESTEDRQEPHGSSLRVIVRLHCDGHKGINCSYGLNGSIRKILKRRKGKGKENN